MGKTLDGLRLDDRDVVRVPADEKATVRPADDVRGDLVQDRLRIGADLSRARIEQDRVLDPIDVASVDPELGDVSGIAPELRHDFLELSEALIDVRRESRVAHARGMHLKLGLDSGVATRVFDAIGFGLGEWKDDIREGSRVDVVFGAEINEWQKQRRLQLNLEDVRLTG